MLANKLIRTKAKPSLDKEFIRVIPENNDSRTFTDRTAKFNKESYIENLAIDFSIPEINIIDAQINKSDSSYYF